jgi:hypothetical protein
MASDTLRTMYQKQRYDYHKRIYTALYNGQINLEQAFYCVFGYLPSEDQAIIFQQTAHDKMKYFVPEYARECQDLLEDKLRADYEDDMRYEEAHAYETL